MSPLDPRTVLGLTSGEWAAGAAALLVLVICLQELGRSLASLALVRIKVPERRRPSSLPSSREAHKARTGVWR